MKSRVDESDADSPQDAPLPDSGAPAARPLTPLDEIFGRVADQDSKGDAAADAASRERLAQLFASSTSVAPVAEPTPAPAVREPAVEPAVLEPAVEPAVIQPEPEPVVIEPEPAVEVEEFDARAVETVVDEPEVEVEPEPEEPEVEAEADSAADELTGEAAFIELGLDEIIADEPEADDIAADEPAQDEPGEDAPDFEDSAISATAVTTAVLAEPAINGPPVTDDDAAVVEPPTSTEPRAPGWLFDSPVPAEPQPYPHNGTFAPPRPRGVRGTLFGSRWRTAVSVAVSVLLVAGLIAGAAVIAQTWAANARLAEAQAALNTAQGEVRGPAASVDAASTQYDETLLAAHAAADGAGPALAAVAGMADPTALDAANVSLAALVAALDEPAPPPAPAPYERGDVDISDFNAVTAAADDARDYAEKATAATIRLDTAQAELALRLTALTETRNALGASLPATADLIAGENTKAEQSFRDAVVAAAAAVGAAQAAGGSGDAELHAYAAAVTALREDQARALAEEEQSRSQSRPRTTNPGTTTPTPTPEPEPTTPPVTEPPPPTEPPSP